VVPGRVGAVSKTGNRRTGAHRGTPVLLTVGAEAEAAYPSFLGFWVREPPRVVGQG